MMMISFYLLTTFFLDKRTMLLCLYGRVALDCQGWMVGQAAQAYLVYQVRKVSQELVALDKRVNLDSRVLMDLMAGLE